MDAGLRDSMAQWGGWVAVWLGVSKIGNSVLDFTSPLVDVANHDNTWLHNGQQNSVGQGLHSQVQVTKGYTMINNYTKNNIELPSAKNKRIFPSWIASFGSLNIIY